MRILGLFDFDSTLGYYDGGYERLFGPLIQRGHDIETIRTAIREQIPVAQFSFARLLAELDDESDNVILDLQQSLAATLKLYDDARAVLAALEHHNQPYVIITCGNPEFQKQKIRQLRLRPWQTIITSQYNTKGAEASLFCSHYRGYCSGGVYVDDKVTELADVRAHCPDIIETVWINRAGESATSPHREIRDLREVLPLLGLPEVG